MRPGSPFSFAPPAAGSGRRAAPAAQRIRAQGGFEARRLLQHGEHLLVSVILPVLALLGLAFTDLPDLGAGRRIDLVTPGVLALAIISTAFTGQAIAVGFDRRYDVLRLLGTTPLGRGGLLAGKAVGVLAVQAVQLVVIGGIGLVLGWRPEPAGVLPAVVVVLLGTWAFVALALLVGGTLRAEGVLAVANLVWVLLLVLGGVIVPPDRLPAGLSHVAEVLPSGALGDGLRAALVDGDLAVLPVLVLIAWGAVGTLLVQRLLRWSE